MYTFSLPDIKTEVDLRDVLHLLMLANQYQVFSVLTLCRQKLQRLRNLGVISWELADKVMKMRARYFEIPGLFCLAEKIQVRHACFAMKAHINIGC